jgi:PhnB protein
MNTAKLTIILSLLMLSCFSYVQPTNSGTALAQTRKTKPTRERTSSMRITTYLLLDGNCKEALEFYHSVFGGELTLTTVGESPMKAMFPPAFHARVVNARLKGSLVDISASDWLRPNEKPLMGNMVCFYVSGGTPEQTTAIFQKLAQGANVTDPLTAQPFGLYGALNDRFGVRWMFHADQH